MPYRPLAGVDSKYLAEIARGHDHGDMDPMTALYMLARVPVADEQRRRYWTAWGITAFLSASASAAVIALILSRRRLRLSVFNHLIIGLAIPECALPRMRLLLDRVNAGNTGGLTCARVHGGAAGAGAHGGTAGASLSAASSYARVLHNATHIMQPLSSRRFVPTLRFSALSSRSAAWARAGCMCSWAAGTTARACSMATGMRAIRASCSVA